MGGRWPEKLDEIEKDLPNDPVTETPLGYRRLTENQAVIQATLPKGGGRRDVLHYELNIAKDW